MYVSFMYISLEVCGFLTKATLIYLRICVNLVFFTLFNKCKKNNDTENSQGERRGNLYYTLTIMQCVLPMYVNIKSIYILLMIV